MNDGAVTLTVPAGWSSPSTAGRAHGSVTASSSGSVSVSGGTITVSHLTLASGQSLTLVYGCRAAGGPGATAPGKLGPALWPSAARSSSHGALKPLR
jgi:hypothetical protein